MIISNNLDLMYKGDACVSIKKWEKLANEILLWVTNRYKKRAFSPDFYTVLPTGATLNA